MRIDLLSHEDLGLGGLILGLPDLGEHALSLYSYTAQLLTLSYDLFSAFNSNPLGYHVTITDSGDFGGYATNDYIIGGIDGSVLAGLNGNDLINGFSGNDLLIGGEGNDRLDGGSDNDILRGGAGSDTVRGGFGDDNFYGGQGGRDLLYGGDGNDKAWIVGNEIWFFNGGEGVDSASLDCSDAIIGLTYVSTFGGNEYIVAPSWFRDLCTFYYVEKLTIKCGIGDDSLSGADFDRVVFTGNFGKDTLYGSDGSDRIDGGYGADRISGDDINGRVALTRDHDILSGGLGSDRFIFTGRFGHDEIVDFSVSGTQPDKIIMSTPGLTEAAISLSSFAGGLSTLLTVVATGDSILLNGVAFGTFDLATDLIFS